jgi:16S rRNA processing protein RimM
MVYEGEILLGKIDDILEVGAGFLFDMKTSTELISKGLAKQFYIPYQDNFIIKIDINSKRVDVKNSMDILLNS